MVAWSHFLEESHSSKDIIFINMELKLIFIRNKSGQFIGAIGVSGGTVEDDLKIARAAADAVMAF